MRIVIHEYENGGRYAYETTDNGEFVRDLEGRRQAGQRIRAAIELQCDNNEGGKSALGGSLQWATEFVKIAA